MEALDIVTSNTECRVSSRRSFVFRPLSPLAIVVSHGSGKLQRHATHHLAFLCTLCILLVPSVKFLELQKGKRRRQRIVMGGLLACILLQLSTWHTLSLTSTSPLPSSSTSFITCSSSSSSIGMHSSSMQFLISSLLMVAEASASNMLKTW